MHKPKLLFINGAQFGYSSGHYFYCKYLTEDFTISYVCYDRGLDRIVLEGVNVKYVSFNGCKLVRIFRFLRESIRQSFTLKPYILFVTYFNICFLLPIFCKSKKTVLDIRSGSLRERRIFRRIDNLIVLVQSKFFNQIIILSESLRKKLYISRVKSKVIPLGSEIYYTGDHNFNTLDLLYVGSINNRNITDTIKGLKLFQKKNLVNPIKVSYTIVGFGSDAELKKLTTCILETSLSDIVKYEGRKSYNELAPYFERSNLGVVFVPQTPYYDCQPATKLFEYLLSGMPVIATNTYENRLVVNNINGVLITDTPEDFCAGLAAIYNARNLFLSSEIRKSVASYNWESIVTSNLKPYLQKW
jgi:glycosyltransferase involved in cell wall biosynthesis